MENGNLNNNVVKQKNSSKIIIIIMGLIIVGLVGYIVYANFIEKSDKTLPKPNDNQEQGKNNEQLTNSFVVQKSLESFYFNVILDTNGNVYLGIRFPEDLEDLENNRNIVDLFNNAKEYSYNDKKEKLVKIDLQNIKDIDCITYGNGGGKYMIFLDHDSKMYVLLDFDVFNYANLNPLTDEKLNNVSKVYPECDEGGCSVYADIIVNGKIEKVSLYDLFEKEN